MTKSLGTLTFTLIVLTISILVFAVLHIVHTEKIIDLKKRVEVLEIQMQTKNQEIKEQTND